MLPDRKRSLVRRFFGHTLTITVLILAGVVAIVVGGMALLNTIDPLPTHSAIGAPTASASPAFEPQHNCGPVVAIVGPTGALHTAIPSQPNAAQLAANGWRATPKAPNGAKELEKYLDAMSNYELFPDFEPTSQAEIDAEMNHCMQQMASQLGLSRARGQRLTAWRYHNGPVTVYTLPGSTGQVAFAVVKAKKSSSHPQQYYFVAPSDSQTPTSLRHLLKDFDYDWNAPSGAGCIPKEGDVTVWQVDRPPVPFDIKK